MADVVRRTATIAVRSAAPVQGRDGPQWELSVKYPWSQYAAKNWIDRLAEKELAPGDYVCLMERAALRKNEDGTEKDGSHDYDFNWKIIKFNLDPAEKSPDQRLDDLGPGPDAASPTAVSQTLMDGAAAASAPSYEDQQARRDRSIQRQVALKAAVELTIAFRDTTTSGNPLAAARDTVLAVALAFDVFLSQGTTDKEAGVA